MRAVLSLLVVLLAAGACRSYTPAGDSDDEGGSGGGGVGGGAGRGGEVDLEEDIGVPEPLEQWEELPSIEPGPRDARGELCRPDGWCWTSPIPTADRLITGAQTPGRVWLGGPGELIDFDGSTWSSSAWSAEMDVRVLDARADDDVWLAAGEIVAHFDGLLWRRWRAPEGTLVLDVAAVGGGTAWLQMGSERPYVVRASSEGFLPVRMRGVRPTGGIAASTQVVIAGTEDGVIALRDGAWHRDSGASMPVRDVCAMAGGQLFAASDSLWRREGPGRWVEAARARLSSLRCGGVIVGREGAQLRRVTVGMLENVDAGDVPLVEADGTIWTDGVRAEGRLLPGLFRGTERLDRGPSVRFLAEGEDASVWGGDVGVARFDDGWTTQFEGAPDVRLRGLAVGQTVLGTVADGVVRFGSSVERTLDTEGPVIGAGGGGVWAAGAAGDVFREDGAAWESLPSLFPAFPLGLGVRSADLVDLARWEAPYTVLRRWEEGAWSEVGRIEGYFGHRVITGAGSDRWVGTALFREGVVTPVLFPEPPRHSTSVALQGDDVWVVSQGQVLRRHDDAWSHHYAPGARRVEVSPRGEVWVLGHGGALYRWNGVLLEPVPTGVSSDLNGVWFRGPQMLIAGNSGVLLSGGSSGFTRMDTGTSADLLAVVDVGDEIFVGTSSAGGGAGLYRLREGRLQAQVGAVTVHSFSFAEPDEYWAAAEPYSMRYENGRWREYAMPARCIAGTASNLWLGFEYQIGHWTGSLVSRGPLLGTTDQESFIADVALDDAGHVWVAGRFANGTGLVVGRDGTWNVEGVSVEPTDGIHVTAGRDATRWVANDRLLYRITDGVAEQVADVLRQPEDMLLDADGRLWVTVNGRSPGRANGSFYAVMRRAQ